MDALAVDEHQRVALVGLEQELGLGGLQVGEVHFVPSFN
jgi:hypothetical protein